jgi:hypothetical protein
MLSLIRFGQSEFAGLDMKPTDLPPMERARRIGDLLRVDVGLAVPPLNRSAPVLEVRNEHVVGPVVVARGEIVVRVEREDDGAWAEQRGVRDVGLDRQHTRG